MSQQIFSKKDLLPQTSSSDESVKVKKKWFENVRLS